MSTTYPVEKVIGELTKTLEQQPIVILQAPPGAGKSTILPLLLLDEALAQWKKDCDVGAKEAGGPVRGAAHGKNP